MKISFLLFWLMAVDTRIFVRCHLESCAYYQPLLKNAPSLKTLFNQTRFVDFILSFITADDDGSCDPYWDAKEPVDSDSVEDEGEEEENGGSLIENYILGGGKPDVDKIYKTLDKVSYLGISFGGPKHTDLVDSCPTSKKLADAMMKVVNKYDVTHLDVYMEDSLFTKKNMQKLYHALKKVKEKSKYELVISLAVPIETNVGIKLSVVDSLKPFIHQKDLIDLFMLKVYDLDTQDYDEVMDTLKPIASQLAPFLTKSGNEMYKSTGMLLMNGKTKVSRKVFTQELAYNLMEVAKDMKMGRVAFFSINRDISCPSSNSGEDFSAECSGINQNPYDFTEITEEFLFKESLEENKSASSVLKPNISCTYLFGITISIALFFSN